MSEETTAGTKPKPTAQMLLMAKKVFPSKTDAKTWARERGYVASKVTETTGTWRLRQAAPEEFAQDSFRMVALNRGVDGVVGNRR